MRTNKKLAIAVTAALFSISGTAFAISGLTNLNDKVSHTSTRVPALNNVGLETIFGTGGYNDTTSTVDTPITPAELDEFIGLDITSGVVYAAELFGSSVPASLPASGAAGLIYEIDGAIDKDFFLTFELSDGAKFSDTAKLFTDANSGSLQDGSVTAADNVTIEDNKAVFYIDVSESEPITRSTQFLLKYQIANADALSSAGQSIDISVRALSSAETSYLVNVSDSITVASSSQAVKIELATIDNVDTKIAVAVGSTEFTNEGTTDVYQGSNIIKIGTLAITQNIAAMAEDGITPFKIGDSGDGQLIDSKLIITDGQFAASIDDPDAVTLSNSTGGGTLPSTAGNGGSVSATVNEEGTTATFDLTDSFDFLQDNISSNPLISDIKIVVDGKTEINVPENSPCVSLTVDYDNSNVADFTVPEDGCTALVKVPRDGTTCWVNIIPRASAVNDGLSILITNNGVDEAALIGSMYGQDGTVLFSSATLKDSLGNDTLGAGKTMRLAPKDLALLMDGATTDSPGDWTGRATLKISTVLSDIEVMALIRDRNSNINSNVSQGAAGASCSSN